MSSSASSPQSPLPPIDEVYQAILGQKLEGDGEERKGFCINPDHGGTGVPDTNNPSASYNTVKNVFICHTCDVSGNSFQMVLIAGKANSKTEAIKWLKSVGIIYELTEQNVWDRVDVLYQYLDENNALSYEVGRWRTPNGGKTFKFRTPNDRGGWNTQKKNMDGVKRIPYHLPLLIKTVQTNDRPVFICEGEKDTDSLIRLGAVATTNAGGAAWPWPLDWAEYFSGLDIAYVLADNDRAGHACAQTRAKLLARKVKTVKIVYELPDVGTKGDVTDWINKGGTLDQLLEICANSETVTPYITSYDPKAVPALINDLSDMGSARWLIHHYGERIRFVEESKGWYVYGEGVWEPKSVGSYCQQSVDLVKSAADDSSDELAKDFQDFALKLRDMHRRDSMAKTAGEIHSISVNKFDEQSQLFNCTNGTIDLQTGELLQQNPADMLTLKADVAYDENAECPKFEAWLMESVSNDKELFEYMRQVMGSCLEARAGTRKFYFIFGPKGTGKSTFVRTLERLLGKYQSSTDFSSLVTSKFGLEAGAASPHLATLRGKRMVSAAESRGNASLDAARIKQLIGGDTISARFLHQNIFEFRFMATLILSGNEMPRIYGDASIWEKFCPVPFLHEIECEDPEFEARELHPEMPGILNFALAGLQSLKANKYRLPDPEVVQRYRQIEMEEQDTVKDFINECIVKILPHPDNKVTKGGEVREAYFQWARRRGYAAMGPKQLKSAMLAANIEASITHGVLTYKNIQLVEPSYGKSEF